MKKKIELIKEYKPSILAAINSYLDNVYNLTDKHFKDGKLKGRLDEDEKLEAFILSIRNDTEKYEALRRKILDEDFDLSLKEINLVAIALMFISNCWKTQIEELTKAKGEIDKLFKQLTN